METLAIGGGGTGRFDTAANASIALREAGTGADASSESSSPGGELSNAFSELSTPSKMESLEVSLCSDTKTEPLLSVVAVSDSPPLRKAEKPFLNEENVVMPFLKPWPKLLEGVKGGELLAPPLLLRKSGRRSELLANKYALR